MKSTETLLNGNMSPNTSESGDHRALDTSEAASRLVQEHAGVTWPTKHDVLGVLVSNTTYEQAVESIIRTAEHRARAVVSLHAVHALVTASRDAALREAVNQFEMVAPDGQPVKWALNALHRTHLKERVYGPELMARLCCRAATEGIPIYLFGSTSAVLDALCEALTERFPGLQVVGAESPPFRELTPEEDEAVVDRINASGAGIVFLGLGAPKQDFFASAHRDRIRAVQVCVGAAFDFHAGTKSVAPGWMQRRGLEWLYRLACEPKRLWRRYLVTNTLFVVALAVDLARRLFQRAKLGKNSQRGDGND